MELTKYYIREKGINKKIHLYLIKNNIVYLVYEPFDSNFTYKLYSSIYERKLSKFKLDYPTHSFEAASDEEAIKIATLIT